MQEEIDSGERITGKRIKVDGLPIARRFARAALVIDQSCNPSPSEIVRPKAVCAPSGLGSRALEHDDGGVKPAAARNVHRAGKSNISILEDDIGCRIRELRFRGALQAESTGAVFILEVSRESRMIDFTRKAGISSQDQIDLIPGLLNRIEGIFHCPLLHRGKGGSQFTIDTGKVKENGDIVPFASHCALPVPCQSGILAAVSLSLRRHHGQWHHKAGEEKKRPQCVYCSLRRVHDLMIRKKWNRSSILSA
jgi:hypothetical protein